MAFTCGRCVVAVLSFTCAVVANAADTAAPLSASLLPVATRERDDVPPPRFYMSGIVGGSFATLVDPHTPPALLNETLWTGGAAVGVACPRATGGLRMEFEALSRENMGGDSSVPPPDKVVLQATGGWSTMVNIWRDYDVTDRLGLYVGGGIGAGGYRLTLDEELVGVATAFGTSGVTAFAWQAGGGVNVAVTDRVTLDLGYRFFALERGTTSITVSGFGPDQILPLASAFSASELLLSVRIAEPFRRLR